jgi:hypothetical protein
MSPPAPLLAKDDVEVSGAASVAIGARRLSLVPSRKARPSRPQSMMVVLPEGAAAETEHEALRPRYVVSLYFVGLLAH